MLRLIILGFLCLRICSSVLANTDEQIWIGYIQQGRVSKHWGYWIDVHHRTKNDFLKNLHANIIRAGATYYLNDHWRFYHRAF